METQFRTARSVMCRHKMQTCSIESGGSGTGGAPSSAHHVIIPQFIQTRVHIFNILDMADVCLSAVFLFIFHYFAYNNCSFYCRSHCFTDCHLFTVWAYLQPSIYFWLIVVKVWFSAVVFISSYIIYTMICLFTVLVYFWLLYYRTFIYSFRLAFISFVVHSFYFISDYFTVFTAFRLSLNYQLCTTTTDFSISLVYLVISD